MKQISIDDLKSDLRAVLDAAERGETTIVVGQGEPIAVIGPVTEAITGKVGALGSPKQRGLLSVVGLLADWPSIESDMAEVIASRESAADRPAPDLT
jgi:prevent-host-death family protein